MTYRSSRFIALIAPVILCATAVQAAPTEQNDYDAGKTPAQLFASDCGICHKSPVGLSRAHGGFGLESFLSEHYTASREAAGMLAKYLQSVDAGQKDEPAPRRSKASAKPKSAKESKASETKPSEAKPDETKPDEAKDVKKKDETNSSETKKSEPKAGEAMNSDAKPKEKAKDDADKSGKPD